MFPKGFFNTSYFPGQFFPPVGDGVFVYPEINITCVFKIKRQLSLFSRDLVITKFRGNCNG